MGSVVAVEDDQRLSTEPGIINMPHDLPHTAVHVGHHVSEIPRIFILIRHALRPVFTCWGGHKGAMREGHRVVDEKRLVITRGVVNEAGDEIHPMVRPILAGEIRQQLAIFIECWAGIP